MTYNPRKYTLLVCKKPICLLLLPPYISTLNTLRCFVLRGVLIGFHKHKPFGCQKQISDKKVCFIFLQGNLIICRNSNLVSNPHIDRSSASSNNATSDSKRFLDTISWRKLDWCLKGDSSLTRVLHILFCPSWLLPQDSPHRDILYLPACYLSYLSYLS